MMGTKLNPGAWGCYANALPDEPMFVLLARDPQAPELVEIWASICNKDCHDGKRPMADQAMVREALKCAHDMREWRKANDGRWRKPRPALAADPTKDLSVPFQSRVHEWVLACFGAEIAADKMERNHRFIEEALELVQANDCSQSEAHQLVDYVFGRDQGEINQEVGGVMVTLAALCSAIGEDMNAAAEKELARIWTKVEQIQAKQAAKPKHSPLPGTAGKA